LLKTSMPGSHICRIASLVIQFKAGLRITICNSHCDPAISLRLINGNTEILNAMGLINSVANQNVTLF